MAGLSDVRAPDSEGEQTPEERIEEIDMRILELEAEKKEIIDSLGGDAADEGDLDVSEPVPMW